MAVDRFPSNYCYSETGVLESYLEYDMVTPSAIGSYLIGIPYNIFNYSKSKFAYTTTSPRDFVMKGFSVEKNDWVVLHEMKDVDGHSWESLISSIRQIVRLYVRK